jgi:hypothetical protein
MRRDAMQGDATKGDATQGDVTQCNKMRCKAAMQCDAMRCKVAMQWDAMGCDGMGWDVMRCDPMRCDATQCDDGMQGSEARQCNDESPPLSFRAAITSGLNPTTAIEDAFPLLSSFPPMEKTSNE